MPTCDKEKRVVCRQNLYFTGKLRNYIQKSVSWWYGGLTYWECGKLLTLMKTAFIIKLKVKKPRK